MQQGAESFNGQIMVIRIARLSYGWLHLSNPGFLLIHVTTSLRGFP